MGRDAHALRKRRSWEWGRWLPGRGVLWIPLGGVHSKRPFWRCSRLEARRSRTSAREAGLSYS